MDDIERVKDRLANIQGVEPIITSMRTIAAGGWRLALRRLQASRLFVENLSGVLATLLLHVGPSQLKRAHVVESPPTPRRPAMVVVASERGLCGAYNEIVLSGAEGLVAQQQLRSETVRIITLGARAEAHFRTHDIEPYMARSMPVTRVPSFEMVQELAEMLIDLMDRGEIDAVYVVYSPYQAALTLPPIAQRWLPVDASMLPSHSGEWPPPIIETDPAVLFGETIGSWIGVRLYQLIMEASASEQAARFRSMDAASTNLKRMIEELTLNYHMARQHAITMEMLDLVAGSGVLRGPSGRH